MFQFGLTCLSFVLILFRGFFPVGGGEVLLWVTPVPHIEPFELIDRGQLVKITGVSVVAGKVHVKV